MCPHSPPCPEASAPDREAAHTIVSHPEQGWSLLCNGIVIFEDTGELLPDGASIAPHRPTDLAFDRPARVVPQHGGQAPAALSAAGGTRRVARSGNPYALPSGNPSSAARRAASRSRPRR
jgi:hypothetical protein